MIDFMRNRITGLALAAVAACGLAACGEGTVTFGGGDDDSNAKVTFKGNLDAISPVTSRDIDVFVYQIDKDDADDLCPCAPDPRGTLPLDTLVGKSAVLSSGETDFTISGLEPGAFLIVFLLDKAGDNADGQINDDDQIAVLDDIDCQLDDVNGDLTVTLEDIDLIFSATPSDDCQPGDDSPQVPGRARADLIRKARTTDGS